MTTTVNNMHEAGVRKAAILVASLDESAADLLFAQLGHDRAKLVRQAAMALDDIDADERQRVIDEFRRIGPMLPGPCPPGIELDGLAASQLTLPVAKTPDESSSMECDSRPFGFLREAEEEQLVQLLGGERPQTVALVLSHLPPERAGEVLARFAPARQAEIVRRLADLENTDPETVCEIGRTLESRLSEQLAAKRRRAAGPQSVARILAACDTHVADGIVDNLTTYDRSLAEQLGCRPLEFDDLPQLDDAALLATFRAADPEVAQAALLGATPELLDRLLRCMDPKEAKLLRHNLNHPGPIRLSDIDDARQQMAALARRCAPHQPLATSH